MGPASLRAVPHGDAEALVRRFYDVLGSGDRVADVAAQIEPLLHPDAEYVNPPDALEPGVRRGHDGWAAALASVTQGLGTAATFDLGELVARGDRVFVAVSLRTGGTASGVDDVAGPTIGGVWTVSDGLLRRFEWFWKPEDARAVFEEAAGPGDV